MTLGEPGEPGEPGEEGTATHGGTGGAGGRGGAGGNHASGGTGGPGGPGGAYGRPDPVSSQLQWVRDQEEKTHRNRRRTNWLVTAFCGVTMVVTLGFLLGVNSHFNTLNENQTRNIAQDVKIIHAQQAEIAELTQYGNIVGADGKQLLLYADALCRVTPGCVPPFGGTSP